MADSGSDSDDMLASLVEESLGLWKNSLKKAPSIKPCKSQNETMSQKTFTSVIILPFEEIGEIGEKTYKDNNSGELIPYSPPQNEDFVPNSSKLSQCEHLFKELYPVIPQN